MNANQLSRKLLKLVQRCDWLFMTRHQVFLKVAIRISPFPTTNPREDIEILGDEEILKLSSPIYSSRGVPAAFLSHNHHRGAS
jgi:hypothetical protein